MSVPNPFQINADKFELLYLTAEGQQLPNKTHHAVAHQFPKAQHKLIKIPEPYQETKSTESLPSLSQAGVSDKILNNCMQSLLQLEPVKSPGPAASGLVSPDLMFHSNPKAKMSATLNSTNRWKQSCVLQRTSNAMSAMFPTPNILEELKGGGGKSSSTFKEHLEKIGHPHCITIL